MNKKFSSLVFACFLSFVAVVKLSFAATLAVDYLCEFGKSYYNMGKYEEALSEFKKALIEDPGNKTAQAYVNAIFIKQNPDLQQVKKPEPAKVTKAPKKAQNTAPKVAKEVIKAPSISREDAMEDTFAYLSRNDGPWEKQKPAENKYKIGGIVLSGEAQLAFGATPQEFIWKRANFDLNEKNKSWRVTSDAVFNKRFNTYDPRVFDRLDLNLDTQNKEGFNFHTDITADPWSFTGKSERVTVLGQTADDSAQVELRYWSNTAHVVNTTVYSNRRADTLSVPELNVRNNQADPVTISSSLSNTFNLRGLKIYRQFQPFREMWVDYNNDMVGMRVFPIAYQDQAYTSDDPLNISNRHIWWQNSSWLNRYTPGIFNSGDPLGASFTKGIWDDSFSFVSKDSNGTYLTALRGLSFNLHPGEATTLDFTAATPKDLWQDYEVVDNIISATRLKHSLSDRVSLGSTITSRQGFKTDDKQWRIDSGNYVGGVDFGFEPIDGIKASAEFLTSKSYYDQSNAEYKTNARGNAYYFSLVGRYPQEKLMDLKYGYDEIKRGKGETFMMKGRFFAARIDSGFDSALSNFHNSRQDTFWSRHIHFRTPQQYFYGGLKEPTTNWDELNVTRIGDGLDVGRQVLGLRLEAMYENKYSNLFDVRNVHGTNGKIIETVVRDEATVQVTDKLVAKGLGIYHKLPKTAGGIDPFVFDGATGNFWLNSAVPEGANPSLKTGSLGAEYTLFDWWKINGIYERTNDYTLAYDNFPFDVYRNDTTLVGRTFDSGRTYRYRLPFLFGQAVFPQAPYEYYNIFKAGMNFTPTPKIDIYLDYTRNEFEMAGQNSDNMNHVGFEFGYTPSKKFGLSFKYNYSRWKDPGLLQIGTDKMEGHHNVFTEFRYLPTPDDEILFQYGEGDVSPIGNITLDPYGGTLLTIDTQHIFRAYYRKKF